MNDADMKRSRFLHWHQARKPHRGKQWDCPFTTFELDESEIITLEQEMEK